MTRIEEWIHVACLALGVLVSQSVAGETVAPGNRLELFSDRHLIAELTGDARLHLHLPKPREVVLVTGEPWEGNTSAYYTIFRDGDLFRMYYRGSHAGDKTRRPMHPEVTCYAESRDGIHWIKPKLGLYEWDGSKDNNIVWNGIGTHCFTVFKDANPLCPPDARYKAISRGWPRGKKGLYIFQSPDGLHWKLMRPEPVITTGAFDSQNLAFWDPHKKIYREFHRTFHEGMRAIMTGTSTDFVNWTDPVLLQFPGAPKEHLYTNAIQPYGRAPHILIGFPTRYLPDEGQRVEPTFMTSRDGRTFHRWTDAVIPESAPKDRNGNRSNYMTWGMVELPGRPSHLSVYATEAYYTGPDSRVRRFEYRKDGFVSVRSGEKGAILITNPMRLGRLAERLIINYGTRKGGHVRVALEQGDGRSIPGYTAAECQALQGDSIAEMVSWKTGDLSPWKGQTVRLRFEMNNADLYSMQFLPWLK